MRFDDFCRKVDEYIDEISGEGLVYRDLPNTIDLWVAWESDSTPEATARACLVDAGWEF